MLTCPHMVSRLLAGVTAVALVLAPVFPAFGHTRAADMPAAHTTVQHAEHADLTGTAKTSPCSQHEGCSTQCCAACAQCFTAAVMILPSGALLHPVRLATASQLHPLLLVAPHNRPPQVL